MFEFVVFGLLALVVLGVICHMWYKQGVENGLKMKVEGFCRKGDETFEFKDDNNDLWRVTVHAICLRRGNHSI